MNKKILLSTLLMFLLFANVYFALVSSVKATPPSATDPTLLTIDTYGEPESSDPGWAYDDASSYLIQSEYEPLYYYAVDRRDGPYAAGKTGTFVPRVATSNSYVDVADYNVTYPGAVEHAPGYAAPGVEWLDYITIKYRFYFDIRVGIPFHPGGDGHNWGALSVDDVEYSFERELVLDRAGGPSWMLYMYMLNAYGAAAPVDDPTWGEKIDYAVEPVDADTIVFNIPTLFPPTVILQADFYSGSILSKAWAQSLGDLDVSLVPGGLGWGNWTYIYDRWWNPASSHLEYDEGNSATAPVGTGPYKFSFWTHGSSWSITKFDSYWDGFPSRVTEDPINADGSANRISGFLTTITWNLLESWPTRRTRLLSGTSDFSTVDRLYRDQVLGQEGLVCYYPYAPLSVSGMFFDYQISTTSPYVPLFYPSGTFGTGGIPSDIFSDVNVRRGFAFAFNYASWLAGSYLGEGTQPPDAIIRGLPYNRRTEEGGQIYPGGKDEEDPTLLGPPYKYYYNMTTAEYYLKLAWGGSGANPELDPTRVTPGALWNGGMRFQTTYNAGNVPRQLAAEMAAASVNSLQPSKFFISAAPVPWGSSYLAQIIARNMAFFIVGWGADYPDPDNFAYPFYHSTGTFSAWQGYNNPAMDALIEAGAQESDPAVRRSIYFQIQELAVNDVPSVTLVVATGRHFERSWSRGWYYRPVASDAYYHWWKGVSELGDANNDGNENIGDKGYMAAHWTGAPGTTYNPSADVSGGIGGTTGSESGLIKGIWDGTVDIVDLGVLSSNWDS